MTTTISFNSLIEDLKTAFHGGSAGLDNLSLTLKCPLLGDKTPQRDTVDTWRRLLQELPLDERSFDDIYAPDHTFRLFVDELSGWWNSFRSTTPTDQQPHDQQPHETLLGFVGLILLTFISLAESDRRRSGRNTGGLDAVNERPANPHDREHQCGALVGDAAVQRVIWSLYRTDSAYSVQKKRLVEGTDSEWEDVQPETLSFHRHGTTSIILRADIRNRHGCALKLILLPFLRYHTIGRETGDYAIDYSPSETTNGRETSRRSNAARVVEVIASSERWILMDFVEGLTLTEFMERPRLVAEKLRKESSIADVLRNSLEIKRNSLQFTLHELELKKAGLMLELEEAGLMLELEEAGLMLELEEAGLMLELKKADLRYLTVDELLRIEDRVQSLPPAFDHDRKGPEVSLDWMLTIGSALFDAMQDLCAVVPYSDPITPPIHGDLTPSNVIVNDVGSISFTLVDLGRNYFYTQSMAGSGAIESAFIAPEVREDKPSVKLADIYSIGQLLQYIGTRGIVPTEMVEDGFYARTPLVARFIEDLVQSNAEYRLMIFSSPNDSVGIINYEKLKKIFCEEVSAVIAADHKGHSFAAGDLRDFFSDILHPLNGAPRRQFELWKNRKGTTHWKDERIGGYTRELFIWSLISAYAAGLAALAVVMWFLRDAGWSWSTHFIELMQKVWGGNGNRFPGIDDLRVSDYHVPDFRDNWPARLVGISYVFAGAKAYQNIFSGLMPLLGRQRGLAGLRALASEFFMRMHTVTAALLVLSATLIEARFWPIASAIGQTVVAFGNLAVYSFAKDSIRTARGRGISTAGPPNTRFPGLISFKEWVPTSFFYAAVVWFIGSLIYVGELHDIAIYAISVAGINVLVVYIVKLGGVGGRDIRISLARACTLAERVRIIRPLIQDAKSPSRAVPGKGFVFRSKTSRR